MLVLGIFIQQFIGRDCWWLKCSKFGPFCRLKFWCLLGKCHYRWVVLFLLLAVLVMLRCEWAWELIWFLQCCIVSIQFTVEHSFLFICNLLFNFVRDWQASSPGCDFSMYFMSALWILSQDSRRLNDQIFHFMKLAWVACQEVTSSNLFI